MLKESRQTWYQDTSLDGDVGNGTGSAADDGVTEHLTVDSGTGSGNSELRLDGTLNAWILLHQAYTVLDDNSRSMMRSMLEGTGMKMASLSLLGSDLRQSNGQFLLRQGVVDATNIGDGTARASLCLLLNGISVSGGSGLAIPLLSEFENDISAMNSYHFGFNYEKQQAKVPVWGGTTLKFMFGSTPISHTFVNSGVYVVDFTQDWNSILSTSWSPLNFNENYLQKLQSISVSVYPIESKHYCNGVAFQLGWIP